MNVTKLLNQFPDGKIPVWYDAGHRKFSEDEYENDGVLYDVVRTTCAIEDAPRVAAEMMWKPGFLGERPFGGLPPRATSSPRNIFISRLIEDGIERQMAVVGAIYPKRKRGVDVVDRPLPATVSAAAVAIEEGRTKPIQEVIDGLRGCTERTDAPFDHKNFKLPRYDLDNPAANVLLNFPAFLNKLADAVEWLVAERRKADELFRDSLTGKVTVDEYRDKVLGLPPLPNGQGNVVVFAPGCQVERKGGDESRAAGHEHETTRRAAAEQLDTYPVKCVRHWQEYHLKVFRGLRRSVRQDLDLSENGAMPPIDELNGVYLALDAAVRSLEVRLGKKHSKTLDQ